MRNLGSQAGFMVRPGLIKKPLKILFLEPFYGGSHREFANGLVAHSAHEIHLVTLPARWWKWRMRGAALHFSREVRDPEPYDLLLTSDLMSLSDLRALWGSRCPPAAVYFHESQLTYPVAPGERMDYQFGFTDITTCLAADRILFNSKSHLTAFFDQLPRFLAKLPEYRPTWVGEAIRPKAEVLYPGCRLPAAEAGSPPDDAGPPLVVWNHRWEHDKNPEQFFKALGQIQKQGIAFRLAVLGERFNNAPGVFERAAKQFGKEIVQWGFAEDREAYLNWLGRGTVVVSTALQENFGIAVVEAMAGGCLPLLPQRLSYPELLPADLHGDFLYTNTADLVNKLSGILSRPERFAARGRRLRAHVQRFAWPNCVAAYDACFEALNAVGKADAEPYTPVGLD
jgi:glycosyltransferase involved in cell wall biosynthesis